MAEIRGEQQVQVGRTDVDGPDSDGSFEFQGLPAGEYVLIVLEDWADFEYANPAAVRPHLETGRPLRLEAGQNQKIRIELN